MKKSVIIATLRNTARVLSAAKNLDSDAALASAKKLANLAVKQISEAERMKASGKFADAERMAEKALRTLGEASKPLSDALSEQTLRHEASLAEQEGR